VRAGSRTMNAALALMRMRFRTFVHPVEELSAAAAASGFAIELDDAGPVWRTIAYCRA
jgi:hypothetical protein